MNYVVEILCRRDGCTKEDAVARVNHVKQLMEECGYDPIECEDIMMYELGLEMDYILDLLL